jgi:phosphomannomutase
LIEGLLSTGVNVDRIGLGPTPMLYFAAYHTDADGGIMVTGSHNPPDQNGFKMLMAPRLAGGGPIYGDKIKALAETAEKGAFAVGQGQAKSVDVSEDYIARLLKDYQGVKGLRVVWDNGNGSAGEILARLVKKLPGEHKILFGDIDGHFPNHHPDRLCRRILSICKRPSPKAVLIWVSRSMATPTASARWTARAASSRAISLWPFMPAKY